MINMNGDFVWWFGVVEDIQDPDKLGRARVRISGYHSPDLAELPTVQLPWAHPVFPITTAVNRGKGLTIPGLLPGSHVFGFFLDGTDAQQPVMMGVIGGINSEQNDPTVGFMDPYDKANGLYDGKPDTNLLALEPPGTAGDRPTSNKTPLEEVETALPDLTWDEPESSANPVYPFNKVYESVSGHIIEVDDSPGAERIQVYHNRGSFIEIHPDGTTVIKSTNTGYQITLADHNMFVAGTLNISALGNVNIKASNFTFKGDKVNFDLEDDFIVNCKKFQVKASDNIDMASEGAETKIGAANDVKIVNGGGAKIKLSGNTIDLNGP